MAQLMLKQGKVFLLAGHNRRGIYHTIFCGRPFTVDFFADADGRGPVAMNPRGEGYFDMVEFFPHQLTAEESERIEHVLFRDGFATKSDLFQRFRASRQVPLEPCSS